MLAKLLRVRSPDVDPKTLTISVSKWAPRYAAELRDVLLSMLLSGYREGRRELRAAIRDRRKASTIAGWDVFNPEILRWAKTYPRRFGEKVNKAWAKLITLKVADGLSEGLTGKGLADHVNVALFGNKASMKHKADLTARTESVRARTSGRRAQWQQSGVVIGKRWRVAPSTKPNVPCPWCMEMNGKVIELEASYFDLGDDLTVEGAGRLKFDYEVVDGPPLHPDCRCGEAPILKKILPLDEELEQMGLL